MTRHKKSHRPSQRGPEPTAQRLQRMLASAGYGSRRQCEELIESGRVEVDGEVVTKLGTTVDPNVGKVRVDGVLLKKKKLVYYAVNKPIGVVTTNRDPQGRPRVVDLVPPDERVFPVGRLDRNSEGLILLTNDGDLAQRLTHPKFGVRKVYRVTVAGKVDTETMRQMRKGIHIAEGFVRVEGARILKSRSRATEMEIVLREGKNREIRRILARLGHKVQRLRRIAVGPLRLGDVPAGAYRLVSRDEVKKLWAATEQPPPTASRKRPSRDSKRSDGPPRDNGRRPNRPTKTKRPESPAAGRRKRGVPTIHVDPALVDSNIADPTITDPALAGSVATGSIIGGDESAQSRRSPAATKAKNRSRRKPPATRSRGTHSAKPKRHVKRSAKR